MEQLLLNEIIEIYLGDRGYPKMEIKDSKVLAYQEIQKRTIEYRNTYRILEQVAELNELIIQLPFLGKLNAITFIDNAYGQEVYTMVKQLEKYCLELFRPHLSDLLLKIGEITNKLDVIWESDPDHLRHSSKFTDSRSLSQSQEYYQNHDVKNVLFTQSKMWKYQVSATLHLDFMQTIIEQIRKSDITVLPVLCIDWDFNCKQVFSFITSYNAMTSANSHLWILFPTENQDRNIIDEVKEDIRIFSNKVKSKPYSQFDLMPNTFIAETKIEDLDFRLMAKCLDDFAFK